MQKAAELLHMLGDHIDAIKSHISRMDDPTLKALALNLPSKAPPGTAEMLMLFLVHREMKADRGAATTFCPSHLPKEGCATKR